MKCPACGCAETNYYHGHEACAGCGRTNDGDCCQGAPAHVSECPLPREPIPCFVPDDVAT